MAQSSFFFDPSDEPAELAARLALPVREGHFDELRGEHPDAAHLLRAPWQQFFEHLGPGGFEDLGRRSATVTRQIREDGISYTVYSDEGGPERPWSLDLLPFLITADEWPKIEKGVAQRAQLLSAILADIYGPQRLLAEGFLPPALVLGNPGYLRPLAGLTPVGGIHLHIVAFDLARAPGGDWWVVGQRTQAPSGLGYALQNRLIISRLFPDAFREMHVQRLASSYRRLLDTLYRLSPRAGAASPRIVLLTPGPYNETYFEHAYLARYLGVPLVEGSDLTVRGEQVFLKTLHGLEPVHAILRRLDDAFCDPLELRPDSMLGIPGLLQAIRAQKVVVANAIGSGFLESPALNGFLPAISERLIGAPLALPSLPSWWCGEQTALAAVADSLQDKVIKPTYPSSSERAWFDVRMGADLGNDARARLRAQIDTDPDAFTVQDYLPLSQAPTWSGDALVPRAAMVRVFAIADADGQWHVLPGGLTRVAAHRGRLVSMQRGGSSMDTWVQTDGNVDQFSMLPEPLRPEDLARKRRVVTSRAAENLFWMGRYAERADFGARLARYLLRLLTDDVDSPPAVNEAMMQLAVANGLVPPGTPSPALSATVFERTLIATLADPEANSVRASLSALGRTGGQIRDRLSAEHWRLVTGAASAFGAEDTREESKLAADQAIAALTQVSVHMAAITGAQTDRMTRDDGWRLLSAGRQLERLLTLVLALESCVGTGAALLEDGFDLTLGLFDSTITYHSLYQRRLEMPPLVDLLVLEPANPRSLARAARVLKRELARLPADGADAMQLLIPEPAHWPPLAALCERSAEGRYDALLALTDRLLAGATTLSDAIGEHYFSHAGDGYRSMVV